MNDLSTKDLLKLLAPFLALTAMSAVFLVALMLRFMPGAAPGMTGVVSFDVIKYTNAQRAVASSFIKPGSDVSQSSELLLNLPARTREAISASAGAGTLVVIKQAVVQGQMSDITDDVLKRLGLPTNVPTADATSYALDMAPTMFLTPPAQKLVAPTASGNSQVLP